MTDEDEGNWGYVCPGCQSAEHTSEDIDKVRNGVSTKSTAESLADIHATKTGHDPVVEQNPEPRTDTGSEETEEVA